MSDPPQKQGGHAVPHRWRSWHASVPAPMGSLTSSFIPAGRLRNSPFPLALYCVGSVLAVKGSLRRFAPWTAPGRSDRRAAHEGKGGVRAVGREGELAHDKGYYHACCRGGGRAERNHSELPVERRPGEP